MFIATFFEAATLATFFKSVAISPTVLSASGTFSILLANQTLSGSVFGYFIFALIIFLSVVLPLLFIVPTILNWRRNVYLRRHGAPAEARILKIWDTGVTVNDNPQVGMLLEVYAADRPTFQAETKSIVSRLQIPMIQVGSRVAVRYDRQDVSKVALVM